MSERPRQPRDRPAGLAPRGTAIGFGMTFLLWAAVPAFTLIALSTFVRDPMDVLLPGLFWPCASLIVILPLIIGFKSRRYWGVLLYFWLGAIAAAMPVLGLAAIAVALVALPRPELVSLTYIFAAPVLLSLLLLPLLLRGLRLRYWQPWTTPDQWEPGDERTPGWFLRAAGRGDLADRNEREKFMRSTPPARPRRR